MADENVVAPSQASPLAGDGHKRKLEDFDHRDAPEPLTESDPNSDHDSLKNGSQENGIGGVDESEAKRPRLESNGDTVGEADDSVPQNGHTEEEKEDEPKKESEVPEPEGPESEDKNAQSLEGQEPTEESTEEPPESITEQTALGDNEKADVGSSEEPEQPNVEPVEESSNLPREGDVPVESGERQSGSHTQILSRKMEVPNDKVGVVIGKAGDTIRSLQDNSGAKIQIVRDADADPRSTSRPLELVGTLESINRAERLIKDVIAEADAGGSPSLVARGFSTVQAASGGEQLEIQVPVEKVGLIIGKGGETIRNMQTRSGARIQLIQPNGAEGDQSSEKMVRVTGNKKQVETAREMIKEVMNQTIRPSPLSGGYNQQGYRPRGSVAPQWGPRGTHHAQFSGYDYPHRYPSQSSQYPPSYGSYPPPQAPRSNFGPSWEQRPPASMHGPPSQGNYNYGQQPGSDYGHGASYTQPPSQPYGHGYNEPKYDHPSSAQHYGHMGSQPAPYAKGGAAHTGYGHQDQYGKPPMYGMQAQAPHSLPYGQPRPNQLTEAHYPNPGSATQPYGQNIPPQQSYPYGSSAPVQQTYPPYGGTTDGYGHTPAAASAAPAYPSQGVQPVSGYSQPGAQQPPAYPQAATAGGYGSYPTAQTGYAEQPATNNTTYGYQGQTDPAYGAAQAPAAAAGQSGYAQPAQAQPAYDQSGGYGNTAAATGYGMSASPQPNAYPQYESNQMYGAHR